MVSEHASPLAVLGGVDAGGQNVHVAALAGALARRGASVVVHTRRDAPGPPRRVQLCAGVQVDHVCAGPETVLPKDGLLRHMGAFADQLSQQWQVRRPDVVHAHFWMSGLAATAAARPLGIPVVMTFHALGVVKRRHQGERDTSPPERLAIERELARTADRIVATCSDEVFELMRLGAQPAQVRVVPCGVDLGSFHTSGPAEARTPGVHRVVCVGRLVERKGVGNAITALAMMRAAGGPDTELVIAGGPAPEHLADDPDVVRLRDLAVRLGVADRVVLRGRVERADLPALLRSADAVVCVPWYEPFGIVPLEAMACGVPVVATAVGGLADTVVHGQTGVHVRPRQPAELAAALADLLPDAGRCAALGRAGALRARSRYSWERVAAQTLLTYDEVLGASASTSGRRQEREVTS